MASGIAAAKKRQEDAVKKQNGDIAPDVDQDGKMINPHNPDFITRVPWYLGNSGPTLKHHSLQKVDHFLSLSEADQIVDLKLQEQERLKQQHSKTTFRKGACKNCGALTHKEKDCVERPRSSKKAAWKSGLDIAADEVSLKLEDHGKVSYSAKRDQWQGYDPTEYKASVVDRFQRLEDERRRYKQEMKEKKRIEEEEKQRKKKEEKEKAKCAAASGTGEAGETRPSKGDAAAAKTSDDDEADGTDSLDKNSDSGSDTDSDSDYDSDEDDDEEDDTKDFIEKDENAVDFQARLARQGGVGGAQMKVTARNLRIREDTPKYLRNLDLSSAFYDPKSRSMRQNPFPNENPDNLAFAGDNFVRYTGDALKMASTQVNCWEMQAHGESVDLISNPSQAEIMHRQIQEKKKHLDETKKSVILEKYGAEQSALDPRLRLGQTEAYAEYSWDGRVVKGAGKVIPRSKYEEDIFTNNHTSVWGSYFNRHQHTWGYECCHSLLRNSYCTGPEGRAANNAANANIDSNQSRIMLEKRLLDKRQRSAAVVKRTDVYGESSGDVELDAEALQAAIQKEEEFQKRDATAESDDRRRGYNSMKSVDVTVEDMEAYRLKKQKRDDPMAAFVDSEVDP